MSRKNLKVNFAAGDPNGLRSTVWRVWAQDASTGRATASDVYLATRNGGGVIKVSLHQDGRWQWSLTSPYYAQLGEQSERPRPASRHFAKWQRPPEFAPGITLGFKIFLPASELRAMQPHVGLRATTWFPPATAGWCHEVTTLLGRGSVAEEDWPGRDSMLTQLVARIPLLSGEQAFVVHRTFELPAPMIDEIRARKAAVLARLPSGTVLDPATIRFHFFGHQDDGTRMFIDLACDQDAA